MGFSEQEAYNYTQDILHSPIDYSFTDCSSVVYNHIKKNSIVPEEN